MNGQDSEATNGERNGGMSGTALFLVGWGLMAIMFARAWMWSVKLDNYSLVDAIWALGIGITAGLWLLLQEGGGLKHLVGALLVGCWSLRLSTHLALRISRAHPEEDARYGELRERWKGREKAMFFGFFQMQALSVVLLALPFLFIGRDASGFGVWEISGTAVCIFAILGEALADHQMSAFRKRNEGRHAVCDVGLWRYSRHPNYFCEFLIWVGFYLFACGSAYGWLMVHAPLVILFLLLRITGVPPSEASSLASKGDAYRAYQRRTSVFIPLPPRKKAQP